MIASVTIAALVASAFKMKRPYMKTLLQIPLRYDHSLRGSFTLAIQKKAIHPQLLPFSSKKLKGLRHDFERASHRFH